MPGGFYTQRVHDKVAKVMEQDDEAGKSGENKTSFEVSDEQRDLIMLIGEEEAALITEDIKEIISEKFGRKGRTGNESIDYFMTDLQDLIDRGLVRKLKYGNLEEYSLTPPGKAYYEKLAEAAAKGEEPPFLTEAQA